MKVNLNKAPLSHCKGPALAVAINVANKCGVGDAHGGLPCNLHPEFLFNSMLIASQHPN